MLDLVTELSPKYRRAYLFGAYALLDAGLGNDAYRLLERGFEENPDAWRLATNAGILMYSYGPEDVKREVAAEWFEKAAAVPGAPEYVSRIAARLLGEGGEIEKALALCAPSSTRRATSTRARRRIAGLRQDPAASARPGTAPAIARPARAERRCDLMAPETFAELLRTAGRGDR